MAAVGEHSGADERGVWVYRPEHGAGNAAVLSRPPMRGVATAGSDRQVARLPLQPKKNSWPTAKSTKNARNGTWEGNGLHPPGDRTRFLNRLLLFGFSAFSVVETAPFRFNDSSGCSAVCRRAPNCRSASRRQSCRADCRGRTCAIPGGRPRRGTGRRRARRRCCGGWRNGSNARSRDCGASSPWTSSRASPRP